MERFLCETIKDLRVHGRIGQRQTVGIPLFWSGACAEVNVTGSKLILEYACYNAANGAFMRVEVDGFDYLRFPLQEGEHKIELLNCFPSSQIKNVRIYRENQASDVLIVLLAFETDGAFCPVEKRELIEFLGDSVTSGEGLACAPCMQNWVPAVFSCRGNYALETAKALNADWSLVSQSGWGVYCAWNNDFNQAVPKLYPYVASAYLTDKHKEYGASDAYAFTRSPKITVINLGANDASAMDADRPSYTDEAGRVHKLNAVDGRADKKTFQTLSDAYFHILQQVFTHHPQGRILLCYNMFGNRNGINDILLDAHSRFEQEYGKNICYAVKLPQNDPALMGSRNHPGREMHRLFASCLVDFILQNNLWN